MRFPETAHEFHIDGKPVARYVWRPELPATVSPRPYLHPVRTLAGIEVTELMPADHLHHLGVSVAIPDLGGYNFWGGRTYVRDRGSVWLDNHGTQRHVAWEQAGADEVVEQLAWEVSGAELVAERRTIAAKPAGDAWALDFRYSLTNVDTRDLVAGSPATNGRAGAGYGGFFWRAPASSGEIRVFTPDAEGEAAVHGSRSRWLAMTGVAAGGHSWTVVFVDVEGYGDPWFVRVAEYPGVGSSLAWSSPVTIGPGEALTRRMWTVVADGSLSAAGIGSVGFPGANG